MINELWHPIHITIIYLSYTLIPDLNLPITPLSCHFLGRDYNQRGLGPRVDIISAYLWLVRIIIRVYIVEVELVNDDLRGCWLCMGIGQAHAL